MPAPTTIPSYATQAIGFLTDRFRQKTIKGIVTALSGPAQELETALFALLSLRTLAGAQLFALPQTNPVLDVLGSIVGQAREGLSDATMQALIFLRVAVNRSTARQTDWSRFGAILLRTSAGPVIYLDGNASFYFFVGSMTLPADAVASILAQASPDGVGVNTFAYTTWPGGNDLWLADGQITGTPPVFLDPAAGQGVLGDAQGSVDAHGNPLGGLLVSAFGV